MFSLCCLIWKFNELFGNMFQFSPSQLDRPTGFRTYVCGLEVKYPLPNPGLITRP